MNMGKKEIALKILYLVSFFTLAYHLLLLFVSSYKIDIFDGSLRLISHIYSAAGLTPYKDFGVVYPPGYFTLLGKIIPFSNMSIRGYLMGFLSIIYLLLTFKGVSVLTTRKTKKIAYSILFLASSVVLFIFNYNDPLSIFYLLLIYVYILNFVLGKNKAFSLLVIFVSSLISTWFRWDWPILIALHNLAVLVLSLIVAKVIRINKDARPFIQRYVLATSVLFLGITVGLLLLSYYLNYLGVYKKAFEFFVEIPTKVIGPYRSLPLPSPKIRPLINIFPYLTLAFLAFFEYAHLKNLVAKLVKKGVNRNFILRLIFVGAPLITLPYALGRSDPNHFIPLWYVLLGMTVVYGGLFKLNYRLLSVLFISFIPFFTIYRNNIDSLIPRFNNAQTSLEETISDCKSLSEGQNTSTVFVGRIDYGHFIYSNVALYLTHANLKPATAFISDEPGLQNSCKYGKLIANQLEKSDKPMLAFLETTDQPKEKNLSSSMKSCRFIEDYLEKTPYRKIGNCKSEKVKFEVRIYPK